MPGTEDILTRARSAADKQVLYLPHAVRQMLRPDRMITTREVRHVLKNGIAIEDYPDDPRGHSCLILGWGCGNRPIHIVCAPKTEYLAIITAYIPNLDEWSTDYKMRVKK